jgi:RNA polymerase sigma-70 factor (ECF subfamily)
METEDLPARIAAIVAAGRARWPRIAIADQAVAEQVTARVARDPELPLDEAHAADLYLVIALAAGDAAALAAFETELVPQIEVALRRIRLASGAADEIIQAMRVELLAGDAPRIADYAGRGELASWLRVAATRKAFKLLRRASHEQSLDDILLDHWPDAAPDPARVHLRATYTAELKRAFAEAFAHLEVRQRNLLRQHILDDLNIDELAGLYRVHRATCARWLAEARTDLGRGTRSRLVAALRLPPAEVESLLRFLDSDLELSISRILAART